MSAQHAEELARIFRAAADGAYQSPKFPPDSNSSQEDGLASLWIDHQEMMSRVFGAIASIYEKMADEKCEPSP